MTRTEQLLQTSPYLKYWRNAITPANLMPAIDEGSRRQGGWKPFDFADHFMPEFVLDFGCGVGRNVEAIQQFCRSANVIGYDLPEREQHMLPQWKQRYHAVHFDWPSATSYRYHTVIAIHVFQHIGADLIRAYVEDLIRTSPGHRLFISTRWWCDDRRQSIRTILAPYYDVPDVSAQEEGETHWSAAMRAKY